MGVKERSPAAPQKPWGGKGNVLGETRRHWISAGDGGLKTPGRDGKKKKLGGRRGRAQYEGMLRHPWKKSLCQYPAPT